MKTYGRIGPSAIFKGAHEKLGIARVPFHVIAEIFAVLESFVAGRAAMLLRLVLELDVLEELLVKGESFIAIRISAALLLV